MTVDRKLRRAAAVLAYVGVAVLITNSCVNIRKNNRMIELNRSRPSLDLSNAEYNARVQDDLAEQLEASEDANLLQTCLVTLSYATMFFTSLYITAAIRSGRAKPSSAPDESPAVQ